MSNKKERIFLNDKQTSIILERDNGVIIELVASFFPDFRNMGSLESQFDFYALQKEEGKETKVFTPENNPNKSLNGLSVNEYIKHGRIGLLSVVRPHEIFKVSKKLKEKLINN